MKDIDRLYRYKRLLTSRHAVSSQELMDALGISLATLKRDMASLRSPLNLPVEYDRMQGGYRLAPGHGRKELPGLWLTPQELVALATVQQLLSSFAPGLLAEKLQPLNERLSQLLQEMDLNSQALAQRIRLVSAGQRTLPPQPRPRWPEHGCWCNTTTAKPAKPCSASCRHSSWCITATTGTWMRGATCATVFGVLPSMP